MNRQSSYLMIGDFNVVLESHEITTLSLHTDSMMDFNAMISYCKLVEIDNKGILSHVQYYLNYGLCFDPSFTLGPLFLVSLSHDIGLTTTHLYY